MTDMQKRLDDGAKALMRLIREAENAARDTCATGDFAASARLHRIAAYMRMAYAEGRELAVKADDGMIRPMGGGKD